MPAERRLRTPLVVGVVILLITVLAVIQVRSQAEVQRSLLSQDNTSLAFLIDDLHRSNDNLAKQETALASRRDVLSGASSAAVANAALSAEAQNLRIVQGLDPVRGPGILLTVDAPLNDVDLQDAVNNLRVAGAEAISVAGRRIVTGTAIEASGGEVLIDGVGVRGPWTLVAIGDPSRLAAAGDEMTRTLRADARVKSASYRADTDLAISSVIRQRPFVYALAP